MSTASDIVAGLGGQENITDLGVVRSGRVVQVVVGPTADSLASEIAAL